MEYLSERGREAGMGCGKLLSHVSDADAAGMGRTAVQAAGLLGISGVCFPSADGYVLVGTAPQASRLRDPTEESQR